MIRHVLIGDVIAVAQAMLAVAPAARFDVLLDILCKAVVAEVHRTATGRAHPRWGNGSLMSAAMTRELAPERRPDDPEFAWCLITVLRVLHREAQPTQSETVGLSSSRLSGIASPQSEHSP